MTYVWTNLTSLAIGFGVATVLFGGWAVIKKWVNRQKGGLQKRF